MLAVLGTVPWWEGGRLPAIKAAVFSDNSRIVGKQEVIHLADGIGISDKRLKLSVGDIRPSHSLSRVFVISGR